MTRRVSIAIMLAMSVALHAADGWAQDSRAAAAHPDYNSGEYLYRVFCASCHGSGGAGDGSVAPILRVAPADLTAIARRNGGSFPRDRVYEAIDGRRPIPGHGGAGMPIWGDVLKRTETQDEGTIRKRIDALAAYIETLQQRVTPPASR